MTQACRVFGVAQDGDHRFKEPAFGRLRKGVEAVLAHKPGCPPGAVANKVQAALAFVQAVARQAQPKVFAQERNDLCQVANACLAAFAKDHKIVHVAAVAPGLEHALDKVIKRVQVDQRIHLAQQIANRDALGLTVVGKLQHHGDKAFVLDLALNLRS